MKKLGFTLAEVLITLVIIGVIAAMAIPAVMSNTNAQEYKTAFKKSIATMNDALQLEYARNGLTPADVKNLGSSNPGTAEMANGDGLTLTGMFARNLNTVKFSSGDVPGGSCIATQDGMFFCFSDFTQANCDAYNTTSCAKIIVDVNGSKGPNILTASSASPRDRYNVLMYQQKVQPGDVPAQEVMYERPVQKSDGTTAQ